jgi:hypothetical protein
MSEDDVYNAFLGSPESVGRMMVYFCNQTHTVTNRGEWDPITHTILEALTSKVQLCFTADGFMPFRGKHKMIYPYSLLTLEQKEALRGALSNRMRFTVCREAIMIPQKKGLAIDQFAVLHAICAGIIASKSHESERVRMGVCNIILQRVQSLVTVPGDVQARLNEALAPKA